MSVGAVVHPGVVPDGGCPLCGSFALTLHSRDTVRIYYRCGTCELIHVPRQYHLTPEQEKARYSLHENGADNPRYRAYLEGLADAVRYCGADNPEVLDFGSGPEAVLCRILRERGVRCTPYDPLYNVGPDAFLRRFDVVILCEVIEHLRSPAAELKRVSDILNPHGRVLLRTQLYSDREDFTRWWYAGDPTHICFFSRPTMEYTASLLGRSIEQWDCRGCVVIGP